MRNSQSSLAPPLILFLVFIALHIIPLLGSGSRLWGADQLLYYSKPTAFFLLLLGVIIVLPPIRSSLIRITNTVVLSGPGGPAKGAKPVALTVLSALSLFLFWYFRNATHFLGDGYLWASHLLKTRVFNEPVSSWLYRGIYKLLNISRLPFSASPVMSSAITSVLSGLVFLVFAYKTARLLMEEGERFVFILLALISTGTMLLFFGYVETYPPLAVGVMAFIYYGIRYLKGDAPPAPIIITFSVTVVLHFSAVALLPSFVLLFWMRKGRLVEKKKYYLLLSAGVIAGLAVLWGLQHGRVLSGFFYDKFLPLFDDAGRNRVAYPLFSIESVFDLFNELILICPISIFIFAGVKRSSGERDGSLPKIILFLETMTVFYILEFLLFNKNIGVSRDWDLFAPLAIPLALLAAIVLIKRFPRAPAALSIFTVAVLIVHTVPWIGLNSVKEKSEARFIALVNEGFWSDHAKGYGNSTLGTYFLRLGDVQSAIRFSTEATNTDRGNVKYIFNLASIYDKIKDYPKAVDSYKKVISKNPDHLVARNNLGVVYLNLRELTLAEREFKEVLARDSTYITSYQNLAYIYFEKGQLQACVDLYRDAVGIDPGMTSYYKNMVLMYIESGEHEKSGYLLEKMLEINRNDPELNFYMAGIHTSRGDREKALGYLDRAVHLAPDNPGMGLEYALALYHLGRKDQALQHLLGLIARNCTDVRIMNTAGAIHFERGEFAKAARIFDRSIGMYPENSDLRVNLARTYYMLGDYAGAWEQVSEAERLKAEIPDDLLDNLRKVMDRPGR